MRYEGNAARKQERALTHNREYTSYKMVNDILNEYAEDLKASGICLFLEGSGICKTVLSDERLEKVLRTSMQMMKEEVMSVDAVGRRYIQVKSMCMQQKLFLKCAFSSEWDLQQDNPYYEGVKLILDRVSGYIQIENKEYENVLMIAIPVK